MADTKTTGTTKWEKIFQYYMGVISVAGYSYILLSAAYILQRNSSKGVSMAAIGLQIAGSLSWLTYGYFRKDPVIKISAIVAVVFNIFLIGAILYVNSDAWKEVNVV